MIDNIKGLLISRCVFISSADRLKKHAYAELPASENHASQGKNVRTNTHNSAFPRALCTIVKIAGHAKAWQSRTEQVDGVG